ncbi:hypothetical protein [Tenacibaculum sp. MAR_2010_89]|uniref:hypothetical protein n=1 Tax=unclassified Tenacibaculum TaxID=2635139 RepID=UPI00089D531F|nr:hypothetical protein [Tenacibaculum sp. MAR_2010_89]SEE06485.1 hypothetical protein SAMN04487765_1272 [Tenacibaculum sp. MAR_2010_89]
MKKVFLTVALFFVAGSILNATSSFEKDEILLSQNSAEDGAHVHCKRAAIKEAYAFAYKLNQEPDVSVFMIYYKDCMGYE